VIPNETGRNRPLDHLLVMDVLHYPRQVHASKAYSAELVASGASAEELRVIHKLVDSASASVDWSTYLDRIVESRRKRQPFL
jgi:non-homologous end joining protein Ku